MSSSAPPADSLPLVASLDMGYGHLRAAQALADALGTEVVEVDAPPLARSTEAAQWRRARALYEGTTRWAGLPLLGPLLRRALETLTAIEPLHPYRDLSRADRATRMLGRLIDGGMGDGVAAHLKESGRALLATYFSAALSADAHGCERVFCVVTDADIARAWAPREPAATRITYLTPSRRAFRRLRSYGVPPERIRFTGFPLPPELLGGPELPTARANLAARLVRLDPTGAFREPRAHELERVVGPLPADQEGRPPLLAYAVGGTGAQADMARKFLPSLREPLEAGRLRLALVAGVREEVAERFHEWLRDAGLEPLLGEALQVLHHPEFVPYYRRFNELLAGTDVLWTKPSEMTFYGGLGIALVLAKPVGVHERKNRRWARERGAALKHRDPRHAAQWIEEWLEEGLLASAAWSGFQLLPAAGTYRILEAVGAAPARAGHAPD